MFERYFRHLAIFETFFDILVFYVALPNPFKSIQRFPLKILLICVTFSLSSDLFVILSEKAKFVIFVAAFNLARNQVGIHMNHRVFTNRLTTFEENGLSSY